jgi:hypothetical protein
MAAFSAPRWHGIVGAEVRIGKNFDTNAFCDALYVRKFFRFIVCGVCVF